MVQTHAVMMQKTFKERDEGITDYEMYILSPLWRSQRLKFLEKAHNKCQKCGCGGILHGHHLSYAHLGKELSNEVIILCSSCHAKVHFEEGSVKKQYTHIIGFEEDSVLKKEDSRELLKDIKNYSFSHEHEVRSVKRKDGLEYWKLFNGNDNKDLKREIDYRKQFDNEDDIKERFCSVCGRPAEKDLCKFCSWERSERK